MSGVGMNIRLDPGQAKPAPGASRDQKSQEDPLISLSDNKGLINRVMLSIKTSTGREKSDLCPHQILLKAASIEMKCPHNAVSI